MDETNKIQQGHRRFAKDRQTVAHESHKKEKNNSTSKSVHESEIYGNEARDHLEKNDVMLKKNWRLGRGCSHGTLLMLT